MAQQFATIEDFQIYGLPASRTGSVSDPTIDKFLIAASARAESSLRAHGEDLPLTPPFPQELVQAVCQIAAFELLTHVIGFNPEIGEDSSIRQSASDAQTWLKQLASGSAILFGSVDTTPQIGSTEGPEVISDVVRST